MSSPVPPDSQPAATGERRSSYDRVAQLEWLFGPRFDQQRNARQPRAESRRYIFVQPREEYGMRRSRRAQRAATRAAERAAERAAQKAAELNIPGRPLTKAERASLESLKVKVAEKLRTAPPVPPTTGPLLITVSLANQKITLYDQGVAVAESPISSGMAEFPTPTGAFSILQKRWFHASNIYSGAPMPYMQRLTWSGIALHGGVVPGYPASHGCIRLPEQFAIRLWGTTPPGTRVIISQNDVQPYEISHPALFVPKNRIPAAPFVRPQVQPEAAQPAPSVRLMDDADFVGLAPVSLMEEIERTLPAVAEITIVRGGNAPEIRKAAAFNSQNMTASLTKVPEKTRVAQLSGTATARDSAETRDTRMASVTIVRGGAPAQVQQVEMPSSRAAAIYQVPSAKMPPAQAPSAKVAPVELPEVIDADADDDFDKPQLALPPLKAQSPAVLSYSTTTSAVNPGASASAERIAQAATAARAPTLAVAPQPAAAPDAIPLPQARPQPALAPEVAQPPGAKPATAAPAKPAAQAKPEWQGAPRPGPLSVFISRATQRIYVRKGFDPLFDLPINVAGNDDLGAYLFTANAPSASAAAFRWTVVQITPYQDNPKKNVVDDSKTLGAARSALDRIKLPEEAITRITELAGVGTTLIVADQPPGKIGPDNSFSVTTSPPSPAQPEQPQGKMQGGTFDKKAFEKRGFEKRAFESRRLEGRNFENRRFENNRFENSRQRGYTVVR